MMEVGTLCLAIDSLIYKLRNINHRLFYLQHCQDFQIPINDDETIRIELALDTIMANFDFLIAIKRLTDKNTISDTDLVEMFTYLTYLYVERQDSIVAHIVQNLRNKRALCQELQDRLNNFKINHKLWI
nr:maco-A 147 [Mamestra configurata nucleopolyhedrovirus A]